jgi:hypothetical protein
MIQTLRKLTLLGVAVCCVPGCDDVSGFLSELRIIPPILLMVTLVIGAALLISRHRKHPA